MFDAEEEFWLEQERLRKEEQIMREIEAEEEYYNE